MSALVKYSYQCASYSTEAIVDADLRGIAPVVNGSEAESAVRYCLLALVDFLGRECTDKNSRQLVILGR